MIDDALSEIPIFKNLDSRQLQELTRWLTRMDLDDGEVILQEGEPTEGLYVLASGEVEVLKKVGDRTMRIATLKAPSVLGEMGVLISKPRTAEVTSKTPVTLGFLPVELFREKLAADNITALRIALNLGRIACLRLQATTIKLAESAELHTEDTVVV